MDGPVQRFVIVDVRIPFFRLVFFFGQGGAGGHTCRDYRLGHRFRAERPDHGRGTGPDGSV